MLFLNRRPVKTIRIGDEITVTVLAVKGNQVRLGIKAPADVSIDLEEVKQGMQRLNVTNRRGLA